ncbi:hypothetical protein [Undibacterium sp. WLX3042]
MISQRAFTLSALVALWRELALYATLAPSSHIYNARFFTPLSGI